MLLPALVSALNEQFGPGESWDHDGIMVDPGNPINRALIALDATGDALRYASLHHCDCVLTHHPLIFSPLDTVQAHDSVGSRILFLAQHKIACASFHTRLDITPGGVNDCLAEALGVRQTTAFVPYGRIGDVPPCDFAVFTALCEKALAVRAQNAVDCGRPVHKVALISGSGKHDLAAAIAAGADTFVTGEVDHAALIDAGELHLNLLCLTHFATERVVLPFLAERVRALCPGMETELYGL